MSKGLAKRSKSDAKVKRKKGALVGWNFNTDKMPTEGSFEVLRIYAQVFRHMPQEQWVIDPKTGRMFFPVAWRPAC